MNSPLWNAALAIATALRDRRLTGLRFLRARANCPDWCAQDHRCTARLGYPSGEHRSMPATWKTAYGVIVASATQRTRGSVRLELRTVVALDPDNALRQAQMLPAGVDLIVRAILATPERHAVPASTGHRAVTR